MKEKFKSIVDRIKALPKKYKIIMSIILAVIIALIVFLIVYFCTFKGSSESPLGYSSFEQDTGIISNIEPLSYNSYLGSDSAFMVTTNTPIDVETLKKDITLSSDTDFTLEEVSDTSFKLTPVTNFDNNTVVSISSVIEGNTVNSWAYETKKTQSVLNVYPGSSDNVYTNTSIEITFRYGDIKDIENYVTTGIKGIWTCADTTCKFNPDEDLEYNKTYTITVKKGLASSSNGSVLENDYSFSFKTTDSTSVTFSSINLDKSLIFSEYEHPYTTFCRYNFDKSFDTSTSVKIYSLNDVLTYQKYQSDPSNIDTSNLNLYKLYSLNSDIVSNQDSDYDSYVYKLEIPENIPKGYYVIKYTFSDNSSSTQLLQISDLKTYIGVTERNILLWVASATTKEMVSNAHVTYLGKDYYTDSDGLLKIENLTNDSKTSQSNLIISTPDDSQTLYTSNYNSNNYYDGYLYTDKQIYQSTDTIHVWGVIPTKYYIDTFKNNAYITFHDKKYNVKVNSSGVFTTDITYSDYAENDYEKLSLIYDDKEIASRSVDIDTYVKPKYTYEIETDKLYYSIDDPIKVSIKAEHISGNSAINKSLTINYNNETYSCSTDNNGKCELTLTASKATDYNGYHYDNYDEQTIEVYGEEETSAESSKKHIYIQTGDVNLDAEIKFTSATDYAINVSAKHVNILNGQNEILEPYNGTVNVEVQETSYTVKKVSYYNPYTKTYSDYNDYTYESENSIATKSYKLVNGAISITDLKYQNITTSDYSKTYEYIITINDSMGNTKTNYLFPYTGNIYRDNDTSYYGTSLPTGINNLDYSYNLSDNYDFNYGISYFTGLRDSYDKKYSINDTIDTKINNYKNEDVSNYKHIIYTFKEEILDIYKDTTEVTYKDEYFPGVNVAGVYFDGTDFHTVDAYYLDFQEKDRLTNITLTTDKDTYSPQDKVKLNVNVKDASGKGLKTNVIISVVDEAVFMIEDDDTDILSDLYVDKDYPFYQASSTPIDTYYGGGGRGSTDGRGRNDFSDTIYFKNIETDENGNATVEFTLNDSITTFRITALSTNEDLYVGTTNIKIPSKLDYYIEFNELVGIKPTDDVNAGYNTISNSNAPVDYTLTLDGNTYTNSDDTNSYVYTKLSKLNAGTHNLTINSTSGTNSDTITTSFDVLDSYHEIDIDKKTNANNKLNLKSTKEDIDLSIYDSSLDYYENILYRLSFSSSVRIDSYVGKYMSKIIQAKLNGESYDNTYNIPENLIDYTGLKELSTANSSKVLTAVTIKLGNDLLANYDEYTQNYYTNSLKEYNSSSSTDVFETMLLLSAYDYPLISDLDFYKNYNRTPYDNVLYALTYAFLGDYNSARDIYQGMLENGSIKDEYVSNKELITILASMIDPDTAKGLILNIINSSSVYRNYAFIAYLKYTVPKVSTTIVNINGKDSNISLLSKHKLNVSNDDIDSLSISTTSNDMVVESKYISTPDEIDKKSLKYNVTDKIDNDIKLNNEYELDINISNLVSGSCNNLYYVLPYGLKFKSISADENNYIYKSMSNNYIICLGKDNTSSNIKINVLAKNIGTYELEEAVVKNGNNYGVSSKKTINISE